jgi:membrane protein YqaA with SNARE-associated domain
MTLSADGAKSSAYVFAAGTLFGCAAGGVAGYSLGEAAKARRHAAQLLQVRSFCVFVCVCTCIRF